MLRKLLFLLLLTGPVAGQQIDYSAPAVAGGGDVAAQANFCGPDAASNVEIGSCTNDANAGTGGSATVVGNSATNSGNEIGAVVIGSGAQRTASGGGSASQGSVVIGGGAVASGAVQFATVIGAGASNAGFTGMALGGASTLTANGQLVMGSPSRTYTDVYFGEGVADATASSYTIRGTGGSGSDNAGGGVTIAPGIGTGTAVGGQVVLQRTQRNATGSSAQPLLPAYISCPVKIMSNSSGGSAQAVATITTTTLSGGSVTVFYTTMASSATAVDVDSGQVNVVWQNVAGTVAAAMNGVVGQNDADSSGTLATTPTATIATNVVTINFTPTWVTIVPTLVQGYATFLVNGINSVVCQ